MAALLAGTTAGLLALTGIVFALLFLVVQFAATAQSPRLHLFRDNPLVWHALGLVVGVIIYATTCVVVTASEATTTVLVPISVIILVVLAVAITRRLQLTALGSVDLATTLDRVTTRTRTLIDRLYNEPFSQSSAPSPTVPDHSIQIRWPGSQQFLREVDLTLLIRLARQAGGTIRLRLMPVDLVRENAVVLEVWSPGGPLDPALLLKCFRVRHRSDLRPGPAVRVQVAQRHRVASHVHGHQRSGHSGTGSRFHREPFDSIGSPGSRDRCDR